ncbi:MAG: hypothetical protein ACSHXB_06130 [Sulfitobacter sp.]
MKPDFRPWQNYADLSIVAALVTAALFLCLLLQPGIIHWLFDITSEQATDLMSRRAGVLFLGLAIIIFQARRAPQSPLRRGITLGIAVMMTGLALLGMAEYFRGAAGMGIWLAICVEVIFAVLYGRFLFGKS